MTPLNQLCSQEPICEQNFDAYISTLTDMYSTSATEQGPLGNIKPGREGASRS